MSKHKLGTDGEYAFDLPVPSKITFPKKSKGHQHSPKNLLVWGFMLTVFPALVCAVVGMIALAVYIPYLDWVEERNINQISNLVEECEGDIEFENRFYINQPQYGLYGYGSFTNAELWCQGGHNNWWCNCDAIAQWYAEENPP